MILYSREDVIGSEELCSVPAYCSDVVFLKSPYSSEDKSPCSDGSPASVQGLPCLHGWCALCVTFDPDCR